MAEANKQEWHVPLPQSVMVERRGPIAIVTLNRPAKRNALNDELVLALQTFFRSVPQDVRAVVITGAGGHFSGGLDLNELREATIVESFHTSQIGQRLNDTVQFCTAPVIVVLQGAVIGWI
jgi:(methylthio)acryloyl-CoA hydratase